MSRASARASPLAALRPPLRRPPPRPRHHQRPIQTAGPAGEIANGTVVIKDGKIAAVGAGAAVPAGARVIDAKGQVVVAGLHRRLAPTWAWRR